LHLLTPVQGTKEESSALQRFLNPPRLLYLQHERSVLRANTHLMKKRLLATPAIAIAFCAVWSAVVVIWAVQGVLSPIAAEGIVGDVARNKADYFDAAARPLAILWGRPKCFSSRNDIKRFRPKVGTRRLSEQPFIGLWPIRFATFRQRRSGQRIPTTRHLA
jgi:hypothetical protein